MTNRKPPSWTLALLGIATTVAGASLTGTSGEIGVLSTVGLGATATWLVLHEELAESGERRPASESEGSA